VQALLAAIVRELSWGLPTVAAEVEVWRRRALTTPDAALRNDALEMLACSRANADGAALFATLTRNRDARLLKLLVTYELMADFLDSVDERGASAGISCRHRVHLAMSDALGFERAVAGYYDHRPWRASEGYVRALVAACRERFAALPAYAQVQPFALRAARLAEVQSLNHELNPHQRDTQLKHWAERMFGSAHTMSWFELTGAASAWLSVLALLAAAAEPGERCAGSEICASYQWVSLTGTMLDSFGDREEDLARGVHSYIAHYPSREIAARRLSELVRLSSTEVYRLRNGRRHAVIVACMVAMYLSRDSTRSASTRAVTASLIAAGGPLTRLLVPVLRLWRIAYGLQAT
jgi:tetraprenyl-beta-curcumene synthase